MSAITENRLEAAQPNSSNFSVRLIWQNGAETVAEFGHLVGRGVYEPMRNPEFFSQVTTERDGRALAWPGEIEFCADQLWFEAHPEDVPAELESYQPTVRVAHKQLNF